jgi:hypothetical protein
VDGLLEILALEADLLSSGFSVTSPTNVAGVVAGAVPCSKAPQYVVQVTKRYNDDVTAGSTENVPRQLGTAQVAVAPSDSARRSRYSHASQPAVYAALVACQIVLFVSLTALALVLAAPLFVPSGVVASNRVSICVMNMAMSYPSNVYVSRMAALREPPSTSTTALISIILRLELLAIAVTLGFPLLLYLPVLGADAALPDSLSGLLPIVGIAVAVILTIAGCVAFKRVFLKSALRNAQCTTERYETLLAAGKGGIPSAAPAEAAGV